MHYETCVGLPPAHLLTTLVDLLLETFKNQTRTEWLADLTYQQARTPLVIQLAIDNGYVAGCKLGYEQSPDTFYSWLGCVDPAYQKQGIGAELMRQQHNWCLQNGYRTVQTRTYNQWRAMLVLNIRAGFDIVGTVQGKRGLTIVLEKQL